MFIDGKKARETEDVMREEEGCVRNSQTYPEVLSARVRSCTMDRVVNGPQAASGILSTQRLVSRLAEDLY